ncbi:basement membrane-specific heparan sulfate proteoglycan core protein-like isoform X2 [Rhineura floridana]|uniref:basement membrane-specific heparan sulfate proteoglycan core protein-like isoform X2 n=1 Tax=Rhineura floridana TaxID=261503 RepID=UPI002AC876B1|nr:basement membrane-specific heparan sulfate proteoglycan core protein-like isoform X2 [Rhineura floridana]
MLDSCHCGVGHRERRCTTQGSMGLSLLLFLSLHMGSTMHTPSVIQTPTSLNVTEGSTLDMKCRIDGNLSKIFLNWYKNGIDELQNSTEIYIIKNETDRSSHFILETADIADSGTYVCKAGNIAHNLPNNGTQVTINEITGFKVNQTPSHISKEEGADVTLECHFRTVGRNSTMCVRWCKGGLEGELTNKTGSCRITQNLRKGFASLTLMNANVSDSGSYTCEVRRESRNHWESGSPSAVVITSSCTFSNSNPTAIINTSHCDHTSTGSNRMTMNITSSLRATVEALNPELELELEPELEPEPEPSCCCCC